MLFTISKNRKPLKGFLFSIYMSPKFYFEKMKSSEKFEKFIEENPQAYFCSGFFVIDRDNGDNKIHFDYFVPSGNRVFSFQLEKGVNLLQLDRIDEKNPTKLIEEKDLEFELVEIEKIIEKEMEKNNLKSKIQKIMLSLQEVDGKICLVGTVFISMLGLLKINISLPEKKVTEFEKKNLFEILKVKK